MDIWHATHPGHQKNTIRAFLNWAMKNQVMARLDLPVIKPGKGNQITQHRRLELIRRPSPTTTCRCAPGSRPA